jgi:hypothetical protein
MAAAERNCRSLAVVLLFGVACQHVPREAGPGFTEFELVRTADATFRLQSTERDSTTEEQVARVLPHAAALAERWGRFSTPVLISIHPTHASLAAAVGGAQSWMRAWARFASVEIESPRTWSAGRASDAQMTQLLAHELTHCVMYESTGSEQSWRSLGIPVWFREGMASVTAQEYASPDDQALALRRLRDEELESHRVLTLRASDGYRARADLVYDEADSAFRYLLDRFGEEGVHRLLAAVGGGKAFDEAFLETLGISLKSFELDFRSFVAGDGAPS